MPSRCGSICRSFLLQDQGCNYYSIVNLRNTNKGYTYAFSASLAKNFDFGLDMSASYTFGRSKSVNDGTTSVAYSNWKYNYSRDTNSENELRLLQVRCSSPPHGTGSLTPLRSI